MLEPFEMLWKSTKALHHRFGHYPPKPHHALRVLGEETNEVFDAIATGDRDEIAEEIADTIVTLFGVAMSADVDFEDIEKKMFLVAGKNNVKDEMTHHFDMLTGKITRNEEK
jgi:NTP pyrophosphatase (non-canonical NTP hydrolase)